MEAETKSSKVFYWFFVVLVGISVVTAYWNFVIQHDYSVETQIECDPYTEACFVAVCDPEEEECSGDLTEDTSYYKLISRNIANFPVCDTATDELCQYPEVCGEDETECAVILCDAESMDPEMVCSDPVEYSEMYPMEETDLEVVEDGMAEESNAPVAEEIIGTGEEEMVEADDDAVITEEK